MDVFGSDCFTAQNKTESLKIEMTLTFSPTRIITHTHTHSLYSIKITVIRK